jgi:hypothetical protein
MTQNMILGGIHIYTLVVVAGLLVLNVLTRYCQLPPSGIL